MSSDSEESHVISDAEGEYIDEEPVAPVADVEADTDVEVADKVDMCDLKYSVEYIIIAEDDRRTPDSMDIFEYTKILSIRAEQIAKHRNAMVDKQGEPDDLALSELRERRCPLVLIRHVGAKMIGNELFKVVEQWDPNTMNLPR